jgi:hypothetical protein
VPVVTFRVSDPERRGLEAQASAAGCTVNELARRRTLGDGAVPAQARQPMSTEVRGDGLTVVYDD